MEVFRYNHIGVFKDVESHEFFIFHNEPERLRDFMSEDAVYVGFNSKHYDQFIVKAICSGATNEEVKDLNDWIIQEDGQGWDYPLIKDCRFRFNNVDIMDDMQMGLSLKAVEAHLFMNIQETEVDFNLNRPLSKEELESTIRYCRHDVDAAEQIFRLRKNYLENKMNIGRLAGIDDVRSMAMTNAKLTAAMLRAKSTPHDDEREYRYPDNLKREFIPAEVFQFFDKLQDKSIPDEEVFKSKLEIGIGDCPITLAYGGIHGAIPHYMWEETDS